MTGRLEWMDSALCAQTDPDLFFPPRGVNPQRAKLLCAGCVVQEECQVWTLAGPVVREGVWAGKTQRGYRGQHVREPRTADRRIVYLRGKGWTASEIGREMNMTESQVHKVFAEIVADEGVA